MRRSSKSFLERVRGGEAPACKGTSRTTSCAPRGGDFEVPRERSRREARLVADLARRRHFPFQKKIRNRPRVERGRTGGGRERGSPRPSACRSPSLSRPRKESASIRATPCGAFRNCVGGFTRKRPDGHEEPHARGHVACVPDAVPRSQDGLPRRPVDERRDVEREVPGLPRHGRDREVAPLERLRDRGVGPRHEPAVREEEGLEREGALPRLERAVLADEDLLGVRVDARRPSSTSARRGRRAG